MSKNEYIVNRLKLKMTKTNKTKSKAQQYVDNHLKRLNDINQMKLQNKKENKKELFLMQKINKQKRFFEPILEQLDKDQNTGTPRSTRNKKFHNINS